jgi:hypothetical protein
MSIRQSTVAEARNFRLERRHWDAHRGAGARQAIAGSRIWFINEVRPSHLEHSLVEDVPGAGVGVQNLDQHALIRDRLRVGDDANPSPPSALRFAT